jgi:asparagine synthase (glutamine-hydrolysing)
MCGIIVTNNKLIADTNAIKYRGSDDFAEVEIDGVSFCFSRLRIIGDKLSGAQPIVSDEYVVLFNGEIYNYCEIASELGIGKPESDGLIIVPLLKKYNSMFHAVDRLCGMFAIVVYDRKKRTISYVRDKYGQKPLWLGVSAAGWVLSSDPRAFKRLVISGDKLNQYLRTAVGSLDLFANMEYLVPGVLFSGDVENPKQSWIELPFSKMIPVISDGLNSIYKAVNISLSGGGRFVLFLSGGVDSSIICSVVDSEQNSAQVEALTYTSRHGLVESEAARKIASKSNVKIHVREISNCSLSELDTILQNVFLPTWDSSIVITDQLMQIASKMSRVAIFGDGADELFGGYSRHRLWYLRRMVPVMLRRYSGTNRVLNIVFGSEESSRVCSWVGFYNRLNYRGSLAKIFISGDPSDVERLHVLQCLLRKNDVIGLSHDVESRSPFLNLKVGGEFLNSVYLLISNKPFLRRIIGSLGLSSLIGFKKVGFEFIDLELYADIKKYLLNNAPWFVDHKVVSDLDVSVKSDRNYLLHLYSSLKFMDQVVRVNPENQRAIDELKNAWAI